MKEDLKKEDQAILTCFEHLGRAHAELVAALSAASQSSMLMLVPLMLSLALEVGHVINVIREMALAAKAAHEAAQTARQEVEKIVAGETGPGPRRT